MRGMLGNFGDRFTTWFAQSAHGSAVARPRNERRQWPRVCSRAQTVLESIDGGGRDRRQAKVADVSQGGVRLLTDQPYEPGSLIHVHFPGDEPCSPMLLACVLHSSAMDPNNCALGCSFIRELDSQELARFL